MNEVRTEVFGNRIQGQWKAFAMRSWRQSGTRFFATALVGGNPANLWYIWVTAATHLEDAKKYRAEIRLASNCLPECTAIYYNPGIEF